MFFLQVECLIIVLSIEGVCAYLEQLFEPSPRILSFLHKLRVYSPAKIRTNCNYEILT